ncbi:MAG: GTP cyclohydrolase I FolE [Planctomycetota bacterium]
MEDLYKSILEAIGEDPKREGIAATPHRAAEAMRYLTRGYTEDLDKVINDAIFNESAHDMVILKDIEIYSLCEHHLLPFFGKCHIGYIPQGRVFGVSKLARVVDVFACRLQLQERLTRQVAGVIMERINPVGVGVVIEAQHLCMMMRGVEKQNSKMITSAMLGSFRSSEATRLEFLQLIRP